MNGSSWKRIRRTPKFIDGLDTISFLDSFCLCYFESLQLIAIRRLLGP